VPLKRPHEKPQKAKIAPNPQKKHKSEKANIKQKQHRVENNNGYLDTISHSTKSHHLPPPKNPLHFKSQWNVWNTLIKLIESLVRSAANNGK